MVALSQMDEFQQAEVGRLLKAFRESMAGEIMLEHIADRKAQLVKKALSGAACTSENREQQQLEAMKAAAVVDFIEETFENKTFGVKVKL